MKTFRIRKYTRQVLFLLVALFCLLLCGIASAAKVTIPAGVTSIAAETFYKDTAVTEVYLPDTVTKIGPRAFADSGLKKIRLSSGLKSIDPTAFDGIDTLEVEVKAGTWAAKWLKANRDRFPMPSSYFEYTVLQDNTIRIDKYIGPDDEENIRIPKAISQKRVTVIGEGAFSDREGLGGTLVIPDSVILIGDSAFDGCSGFTGSLTIPDSVTTIEKKAFWNCGGFTGSLTIGNSVATIGNSAFNGNWRFTGSLTIPASVTGIGNYAFYGCSGFTGSLVIPSGVGSIGDSAFENCTGLSGDLTISDGVQRIEQYAFYNCTGFASDLTVPASVTGIGARAFTGCTNVAAVYVYRDSVAHTWFTENGFSDKLVVLENT